MTDALVQITRTSQAGAVPPDGYLAEGELAVELAPPYRLWIGGPGGSGPPIMLLDGALTGSGSFLKVTGGTLTGPVQAPQVKAYSTDPARPTLDVRAVVGQTEPVFLVTRDDGTGTQETVFKVTPTGVIVGDNSGSSFSFARDNPGGLNYINVPNGSRLQIRGAGTGGNVPWAEISDASGWLLGSDRALKTNIVPIDQPSALAKVRQLLPVMYDLLSNNSAHAGLIAQDVELVAPEVVKTLPGEGSDPDIKALDEMGVIALLLAAFKELADKVEASGVTL